jgi:DNA-binding winged helix-turn-helix (wHTH) protein
MATRRCPEGGAEVPDNQNVPQLRSSDVFLSEGFRLDRHCLYRVDQANVASAVSLGSRALDLARLLVQRHGELVSKDEIMDTVWRGMAVEENNLTVQISTLVASSTTRERGAAASKR